MILLTETSDFKLFFGKNALLATVKMRVASQFSADFKFFFSFVIRIIFIKKTRIGPGLIWNHDLFYLSYCLLLQFWDGGHFDFGLIAKNAKIFQRGIGAIFFLKGPKKWKQLSNLPCHKMVTGLKICNWLYWTKSLTFDSYLHYDVYV